MKMNFSMIKKAVVLMLGAGGIILANMTVARWLSLILSSVVIYFLYQHPSIEAGLIYWGLSMVFHYTVLFGPL
jgi:hypothetical protein